MSPTWPSEQARETYIRFLELEIQLMRNASEGRVDDELLERMTSLLSSSFPRTRAYLEKKLEGDVAALVSGELRTMAWAEARSRPGEGGQASVPGTWTER